MLLYNVTVKINKGVEQEWLQWMQAIHIPDVMNTGMFIESHICRLLESPPNLPPESIGINYGEELLTLQATDDDPTYVIQYVCENNKLLDHYFENHAPALREDHDKRYKNKFVAFRTVMEVVSPS